MRLLLAATAIIFGLAACDAGPGLPSTVITVRSVQERLVNASGTEGAYPQVTAVDGRTFSGRDVAGLIAAGGRYRIWLTTAPGSCTTGYAEPENDPDPCIASVQELSAPQGGHP